MKPTDFTSDFPLVPELGVEQSWQALLLLPHRYTDLSKLVTDFSRLHAGMTAALVRGRVVSIRGMTKERQETKSPFPAMVCMVLSDGANEIVCEAFQVAAWRSVDVDDTLTVYCKVREYKGVISLGEPVRERCRPEPRPDYKGIPGKVAGGRIMLAASAAVINQDSVRDAALWLINERSSLVRLINKHWGTVESLLLSIHAPATMQEGHDALDIARRVCVAEVRLKSRMPRKNVPVIPAQPGLRRAIWEAIQTQPETFSPGQMSALKEAVPALSGDKPARVLINGDVGSGKTLVFLSIVAGFAKLGIACAVMAPTGSVARQIYTNVTRRFPGLSCRYIAEKMDEGPADALVYIGTHALLTASNRPEFGAVVVDEQQKFSREQREGLLSPHTHFLQATATPIPQTLAAALFDDCVVAKVPTPPVDRQIRSHILGDEDRAKVGELHRAALAAGKKVLYVYAAVNKPKPKAKAKSPEAEEAAKVKAKRKPKGKEEEAPKKVEDVRAATTAYEEMQAKFPGQVAIVHGQMHPEKAAEQLQAFHEGRLPILISTTAVEVGVDSPGIRLVVVNDPDRLGLFQLHQLRGRAARDGGNADFVMFVKKELKKVSMERLLAVRSTTSGFKLAEEDLKARGFGEVAGELQTGASETTFRLSQLTPEDFVRRRPSPPPLPLYSGGTRYSSMPA